MLSPTVEPLDLFDSGEKIDPPHHDPPAQAEETLPTPSSSQQDQASGPPDDTSSSQAPPPPWEAEADEDSSDYQERVRQAMGRDRSALYIAMRAVTKHAQWPFWSEEECELRMEKAKNAQVLRRKQRGLYVSCLFEGFEEHEYVIRVGLQGKRERERREVERVRREEAEGDDDEGVVPGIKRELCEGVRFSAPDWSNVEEGRGGYNGSYRKASAGDSENGSEIDAAILRNIAHISTPKEDFGSEAGSSETRDPSLTSSAAHVKAEEGDYEDAESYEASTWAAEKAWTPARHISTALPTPETRSSGKRGIADNVKEADMGDQHKRVKVEDGA